MDLRQFADSSRPLPQPAATPKNADEPTYCPFCGDKEEIHTFLVDWSAKSNEDESNAGVLNEHQCGRCGASFWT